MSMKIAQMPGEQMESLRRQFDLLDTDEDGHISPLHLTNVLRSIDLHITDKEMADVMAKTDVNGDGIITFEDFVQAFRQSRKEELARADHEQQANLRQTFQIFDRRNLGTISPKDIFNVLRSLGKTITLDEIEDIVAEIDQDGDSRISYSEFVQCVFADDE